MKGAGVAVIQIKSEPKEAIDLLEKALKKSGITVYARIDQQDEARKSGVRLLPTEFLMFGNPAKGGPIMQSNILAALDLLLKVLAYQDEGQNNFVAFNTAEYLADRFALTSSDAQQINIEPLLLKLFN